MNHVIHIDAKSLMLRNNNHLLTKSLFLKACECPRRLAYYNCSNKYKIKESSSFLQNLSNDGKKIERYARAMLFDNNNGVLVKGTEGSSLSPSSSSFTSIDTLVTQTRHLLESHDEITLFEAAFLSHNCFMRADILHKSAPTQLHVLEVKTKAWNASQSMVGKRGGIKSDFLPYIRDVAFQKYILQQCYPDHDISASLVMPDTTKVNTTIPNLNQMFSDDDEGIRMNEHNEMLLESAKRTDEILVTAVPVDDLVEEVLSSPLSGVPGLDEERMTFEQAVALWGDMMMINNDDNGNDGVQIQPPPIGSQCRDCEFRTINDDEKRSGFAECWESAINSNEQNDLIIDIHYIGKQTVEKLIQSRKFRMCDVTTDDLKLNRDGVDTKKKDTGISRRERQWLQVKKEPSVVLDREYLQNEMETWQYPWHFVDFETIAPALPFTIHKRPFQVMAFQFSHHALHEDGRVEHISEFLHAIPGECPNRAFLEALSESLSNANGGTVFRWGSHENTVLAALLDEQDDRNDHSEHLALSGRPFLESLLTTGDNSMVDLMRVCEKGYFAPRSGASSSIKKLLLPTMRASGMLQQTYSQPYTGKNFTDMTWWQQDDNGELCDPYVLLGALKHEQQSSLISQGGDAIVAYNLLQNCSLDIETRLSIENSLLRYCELDTLAMVMIAQGLVDLVEQEIGCPS